MSDNPPAQTHTWAQECQIAERGAKPPKPIVGYEFSNDRKFQDKVDKTKSYE